MERRRRGFDKHYLLVECNDIECNLVVEWISNRLLEILIDL